MKTMKKTTIGLVALSTLIAACSNDDLLQENEAAKTAIGFDGFVGNSVGSRSGADATFEQFQVWSNEQTADGSVKQVFTGMEVAKQSSGSWEYSPLEYWTKGSSYWFAGLANNGGAKYTPSTGFTSDGAVGEITLDAFAATNDLVYAYAYVAGSEVGDSYQTPVAMNFKHLFSRFDFKFKNNFPAQNTTTISIKDLTIQNIPSEATLTLTQAPQPAGTEWDSWVLGTKTMESLKIGTSGSPIAAQGSLTTTGWYYLIPVKGADYTVTFTITRDNGTTYHHVVKLPKVDLEMGYSYTFVASIDASNINPDGVTYPITFTVETNNWENAGDKPLDFPNAPQE